jgi:hypothetical protein
MSIVRYSIVRYLGVTLSLLLISQFASATDSESSPTWLTNYAEAMSQAKQTGKPMLVYFHQDGVAADKDSLCQQLLSNSQLRPMAEKYVLTRVPLSYEARVGGKSLKLLSHSSFAELGRQSGIAVIDFTNAKSPYYGHVVSVYPMSLPAAKSVRSLKALLTLPEGSLTQRTLILAVRLHPEAPESTEGTWLTSLAKETESHSRHQASINRQGHHHWERRFHRISAILPGGGPAQEVCAESWPGMGLVAAAMDCVHSWRQSSGHWSAVRNRHRFYGYDMKRGSNGIWYATGIFSEH